ncbi:hypothetical protein SARC_15574, partial [Sphaeroforma arctica JP610]
DYYAAAETTTKKFERKLAKERRKRERVEQTLSDLARQHRRLETKVSHIGGLDRTDSTPTFQPGDESDDEFYDVENDEWVDEYEDNAECSRKPSDEPQQVVKGSMTVPKFMTHYRNKIPYRLNKKINFWCVSVCEMAVVKHRGLI